VKRRSPKGRSALAGFNLIECLIVLSVLGIAATTIISLQTNIFKGQTDNKTIQVAVQSMQECAERVLAAHKLDYNTASLASSSAATAFCGGSNQVTITAANANSACASAGPCNIASITQGSLPPIVLLLVNY
jgi:prepilin-type N-terminal cleavage/methylation domain-containing protein